MCEMFSALLKKPKTVSKAGALGKIYACILEIILKLCGTGYDYLHGSVCYCTLPSA